MILGSACGPPQLVERASRLLEVAAEGLDSDEWPTVEALEILVPIEAGQPIGPLVEPLESLPVGGVPSLRLTVSAVEPDGTCVHRSFSPAEEGLRPSAGFHGIHPEAARRVDLDRLDNFELERLAVGDDGIYCFHGRS